MKLQDDKPLNVARSQTAKNACLEGAGIASGSHDADYTNRLLNDVFRCLWVPETDRESWRKMGHTFVVHAMCGIEPKTEHEGMLAAQIVAAHAATMECFRRAAITDQFSDARKDNLNLANKSARTFAMLTETLMKLRGESGKQSVHVHHHHHDGRTQIAAETATVNVGAVTGGGAKKDGQPYERQPIDYAPGVPATAFDDGATVRGEDEARHAVPVPRDEG